MMNMIVKKKKNNNQIKEKLKELFSTDGALCHLHDYIYTYFYLLFLIKV